MKKVIIEDTQEGFEKFLGQKITLYCDTFIYSGLLSGVNDECVLLTDAEIVYDTGSAAKSTWELAEKMPNDWYVMKQKIESFGLYK